MASNWIVDCNYVLSSISSENNSRINESNWISNCKNASVEAFNLTFTIIHDLCKHWPKNWLSNFIQFSSLNSDRTKQKPNYLDHESWNQIERTKQ